MRLKEVKLEYSLKLIQHPSHNLSVAHRHSWQWLPEIIVKNMDTVGGYYSSTDHNEIIDITYRHRASTVTVFHNRTVTKPSNTLDLSTRGSSQDYYKAKAHDAARKLESCGIIRDAEPSKESFRTRTTSMSSYFLKSSKCKFEKPRMKGTEEFWNQYRRKSSVVSLSTLMKQILFPSHRIKISSLIWYLSIIILTHLIEIHFFLCSKYENEGTWILFFRARFLTVSAVKTLSIGIKESNNYGFLSKIIGSRYQQ